MNDVTIPDYVQTKIDAVNAQLQALQHPSDPFTVISLKRQSAQLQSALTQYHDAKTAGLNASIILTADGGAAVVIS